mmetsp:Transcript_99457/g.207133  ORF Transcript_99457/g.207133 Transcript_99457/m.207133 type:complete len:103 (-) Transcript_99457:140-448(-)|eukprot:CAMPEP_0206429438 /NCGR_PEP_ID=MMETSP0324_2-20121206/6240_1 /ASSEMBLY_ACC=CAM_ASM_000836 /TAXON_ID=2866 /ORGANISM="Crypthecodinium cohnii, Strain Seligo" /LENGTH=102 /DNA_ID=CAMNT_0053895117 /DNA_START=53 /DNA_END=361 /DNA_ORIENTATION=-
MGKQEEPAGEDEQHAGGDETRASAQPTHTTTTEGAKRDFETDIQILLDRAKSRLAAVRAVEKENSDRIKTLKNGFKELKGQQLGVSRDQAKTIGNLQSGLKN